MSGVKKLDVAFAEKSQRCTATSKTNDLKAMLLSSLEYHIHMMRQKQVYELVLLFG